MTNIYNPSVPDIVSLEGLAKIISSGWRIVLLSGAFSLLFGILYLQLVEHTYTAEMGVSPVPSEGSSARSVSSLSGLASLAGVSLPQGSASSQLQLYVETLKSFPVAEVLSKKTELMQVIFKKDWNTEHREFSEPKSVLRSVVKAIKYTLGIPVTPWRAPNGSTVQEYLYDYIDIEQSPKKLIVAIKYKNYDPNFAIRFVRVLHETTDNIIRQESLRRANLYSIYLQDRLAHVTVSDYRATLTQTLLEQEKVKMAASANVAFAAQPFGAPGVPPEPDSPNALIVLVVSAVLGGLIGVLLSLLMGAGLIKARWIFRLA